MVRLRWICILLRMHGFFFSSRRRHTRFDCDWSSDVCSSDLACLKFPDPEIEARADRIRGDLVGKFDLKSWQQNGRSRGDSLRVQDAWESHADVRRSEERRVGEECRSRWSPDHLNKKR